MTAIARNVFVLLLSASACFAQPAIQAVVNAASYTGSVAPGSCIAIFGSRLAAAPAFSSALPLPLKLNGVSVTIGGIAAPLLYVSPGQVNAIVPFTAAGSAAPLIVTTADSASEPFSVALARNAPAIFTQNGSGTGNALAFDANLKPVGSLDGGPIILYATGLGATDPAGSSDSGGASSEPLNRVRDSVNVFVGDAPAVVQFAGLAPGLPGVYQLNVVPNKPISNRVYILVNGAQSNVSTLAVPVGINTANVTGSIDSLYPPTSGAVSFSQMLFAAAYQVSFDILPNAKPFQVTARTQGATAVVDIDPVRNTWTATLVTPTAAQRAYDFSGGSFSVIDFLTGRPFPGNIVPVSRQDPLAVAAAGSLPLPNTPSGLYLDGGSLPANRHFSINANTLAQISRFGGFRQISPLFGGTTVATVELFVDGLFLSAKDVTFLVD